MMRSNVHPDIEMLQIVSAGLKALKDEMVFDRRRNYQSLY